MTYHVLNLETGEIVAVEGDPPKHEFTMMEALSFCDMDSPTVLRCPRCGRWIRADDRRKPRHVRMNGPTMYIHCNGTNFHPTWNVVYLADAADR